MTTRLRVIGGWRLVYDRCTGCGEMRDVVPITITGALMEIPIDLCRYCARELRIDVGELPLRAGWDT